MSWDKDALWSKSKVYIGRAFAADRSDELFPFWVSLSLELLARAALSSISPLLLAEPFKDNPASILYALGRPANKPKSLAISSVFKLCESLVPGFTAELSKVCSVMADVRNQELHSGAISFASLLLAPSWLKGFYQAASALATIQGHTLQEFLGEEEFQIANEMLTADTEAVKAKVQQTISTCQKNFNAKSEEDRQRLAQESATHAAEMSWHGGHKVQCPSCKSQTFVTGQAFPYKDPVLEDGEIVVRRTMLPTGLKCEACGLHLTSHAELEVAQLGEQYTRTAHYDPVDYFYDDEPDGPEYDNE